MIGVTEIWRERRDLCLREEEEKRRIEGGEFLELLEGLVVVT